MNSDYRKMRVILMFDLPTVEKIDQQYYQTFIKNLKKIGFYMLQYSIYVKALTNQSDYNRIKEKISKIIPKKGNIIILKLTEKQYNDMIYLNGTKNRHDIIVGNKNIVYFGEDNEGTIY